MAVSCRPRPLQEDKPPHGPCQGRSGREGMALWPCSGSWVCREERTFQTFCGHPLGSFISFKLPKMQVLFLNFVLEVSGERDAWVLADWLQNSCTISKVRSSRPEPLGAFLRGPGTPRPRARHCERDIWSLGPVVCGPVAVGLQLSGTGQQCWVAGEFLLSQTSHNN